jgi:Lhr-like helicase
VFVNTRRMAERVARELSERLDDGAFAFQLINAI